MTGRTPERIIFGTSQNRSQGPQCTAMAILGALRLTLGHDSTDADVELALRAIPASVSQLLGFPARTGQVTV